MTKPYKPSKEVLQELSKPLNERTIFCVALRPVHASLLLFSSPELTRTFWENNRLTIDGTTLSASQTANYIWKPSNKVPLTYYTSLLFNYKTFLYSQKLDTLDNYQYDY